MNQYFEVIGVSSGGDSLHDVETDEGIRVIPVEMTRKITFFQDIKALYTLYRIFRKERPLIVHTHTPKAGIVGMLAALFARVPCRLHTVAGLPLLESKGIKRRILILVEKITYKCATNIYPNSFGLRDIILRNKFTQDAAKIKVIAQGSSNGIDTVYFDLACITDIEKERLRNELKINDTDFVFIFVGRMVKDKGIHELIGAFVSICEKYSDVKLLLVGPFEPDLDPILPETEQEIHTNPHIIHVGFQADVRPYFAVSDVLVFPSYREGFPNVVMQAGAMGLPAIVTDINGCNEIIIDGESGIIIPPKNEDRLKEKMKLILEDEPLRNTLKNNARKMIMSRYEQRMVWEALLWEYEAVAARYA